MQCEKCRGTGISPDSTPAMGIKCDKCEGGEKKTVVLLAPAKDFNSFKPSDVVDNVDLTIGEKEIKTPEITLAEKEIKLTSKKENK